MPRTRTFFSFSRHASLIMNQAFCHILYFGFSFGLFFSFCSELLIDISPFLLIDGYAALHYLAKRSVT